MRIIRIKFSNINNLKGGPWEIQFDRNPIRSAGLFAITGPTGSGKSTLLDVITLALFNKIPRFPYAISSPKMEGLGSVLTRNTNKGFAEVEYEMKGKRFISKWGIARNRNGKLKDYEMTIQDETGYYLDVKRSEVPSQNEKIIGLNYQQFLKSIILAQGEFSKFIKAEKNERSKLLEQLTGTSIYRKIGMAAFQKHKAVTEQLKFEQEKIKLFKLLEETEVKEYKTHIKNAIKEKESLDAAVKKQAQLLKIKTDLKQQQIHLSKKENEFRELAIERKAFQPELKRLGIHEKLTPAQSELTQYQLAKNNKEQTEANLLNYQKELNNAGIELENTIQKLGTITQRTVNQTNFKSVMDSFEKEINHLDFQINQLLEDGQKQRKRIKGVISDNRLEFSPEIQPETALSVIQESQQTLEKQIKVSGLNTAQIADPELLDKQNTEQLQLLDKLKTNIKRCNNNENENRNFLLKIKSLNEGIKQVKPLISKSTDFLKTLEDNKQLLIKQQEDTLTIKSLEEHRSQLIEGKPCPLCGAESHPFADHLPEDTFSELEDKLLKTSAKIDTETALLRTYEDNVIRQETELISVQTQIEKITEANEILKKETLSITKQLTSKLKSLSSETEVQKEIKRLTKQKQGISASRELKTYESLFKDFDELRLIGQKYNALKSERQTKYSGKDVSDELNLLQDKFNNCEGSIRVVKNSIERETNDLKRAQKMLYTNLKFLQPKLATFGLATVEELSEKLLEEKEVEQLRNKQKQLTEQHTTLSTEINTFSTSIEQLKAQDNLPELALTVLAKQVDQQEKAREELARNIGSVEMILKQNEERQEEVKTQQAIIVKLEKEHRKWDILKRLIGDAEGKRFASFAQALTLKNLLVLANHRLQKLSDRYLLDQPTSDGALNVVDQYQGNTIRAISTLSGGESFMVSLALALSLSDMASRNNPLDSLFIDEGFGSLDQETLGIAIDTLERLQAESSKTVGVISHVEALKERIDVQIQLERGPQGYSTVSVKG